MWYFCIFPLPVRFYASALTLPVAITIVRSGGPFGGFNHGLSIDLINGLVGPLLSLPWQFEAFWVCCFR